MIDRFERVRRRVRCAFSRTEWTARLLGLPPSEGTRSEPGVVIIQVDGLSCRVLSDALASRSMPFARKLLADEGYRLHPVYSGLPSSTPAAQAELFYGVPLAVPAFGFVDHCDGRLVRMWQHEASTGVERRLAGQRALLEGGSSYCNVYTGGAAEARFCMSSLGLTDVLRTRRAAAMPLVALLYAPDVLRAAALVGRELLAAPCGAVSARATGQHATSELKFILARPLIAVMLREIIALGAMIDIARGLPIVHLNLLGYDEYAHRRGPDSPLARHALGDIDVVIGRLVRAARRSERRAYDVWVLSDHGQEETVPYVERHGRLVRDAVVEVFRAHGMESRDVHAGHQGQRVRALSRRIMRRIAPGLDFLGEHRQPGRVTVTAQGPLGHVYAPRPLDAAERDVIAAALVDSAGVPLVLAPETPGTARAWTSAGTFELPRDAGVILGEDHPYLSAVAEDLVRLCHHPDAGEFVISGWQLASTPVSFPHENGSHAGPGPGETDAFLLVPSDTPLSSPEGRPLRAVDVRQAAFAFLDRAARPLPRIRSDPPATPENADVVRLLTYNVHSCIGLDDRLSPERIARVIARHDPDVVALQELDVGRPRTGGVDQAQLIAEHLEMLAHFHPALSVEEERYGDAVLSRLPMRLVRAGALPSLPSRPLEPRGALWVEITSGPVRLQVVNTHLSLHPAERSLQVDALLGPDWLGAIQPDGGTVLCGDFNALGWFPVCRRITRSLRDVQVGRHGYRPRSTWPGRFSVGRIDHVFVDPAIEVRHVEVPDDALARVASDHLPLIVDLHQTSACP